MMVEMLRRVCALVKKEFITIWKDPKSRAIICILPIMQLLIFANAITMEVKNIDVAVLDRSHSVESRELISRFENSSQFRHFYYVQNEHELKEKMDSQEVMLGLLLQGDFSKRIKAGKSVSVQIIADGRQTNSASIASGYASQIINGYSAELNPHKGAKVELIVRNWYNANLEYRWYILTVIVAMLACVVTLLLTALSIAREREIGTFDQLIVSPLTSFEILLGKTIPPISIAMGLTCLMAIMVTAIFNVPFAGSPIIFLFAIFIALLSLVGVGLFISSICKTQQQAILGVITFQMPAVLLSGFISPIEDMPEILQYLTYLNPMRFFMVLSRGIFLKGMGAEEIIMNLIPLLIIAIITLSLAGWSFKKKLN